MEDPVGSYVYFYRAQAQPGTSRTFRWHGPARVIGVDLRNQRGLEDQELPTAGGQPHSHWLQYGSTVVVVTGEQLRFASEDELLAAHMVFQEIVEPPYARGARNYVDLQALPSGSAVQVPLPELCREDICLAQTFPKGGCLGTRKSPRTTRLYCSPSTD